MRLFGYARISTSQQSLEIQKQALHKAGVKESRIFYDKLSDKDTLEDGINLLLTNVKDGDVVLVTKFDKLGRDTADMARIINQFNLMNVVVRFLNNGISTEGEMGRMIVTILSASATAERNRMIERTNEGRIEAMSKGIQFGRKRVINRNMLLDLKSLGKGATTIAKEMNISRATIYKILKEKRTLHL